VDEGLRPDTLGRAGVAEGLALDLEEIAAEDLVVLQGVVGQHQSEAIGGDE
jgi:hypothetical protein